MTGYPPAGSGYPHGGSPYGSSDKGPYKDRVGGGGAPSAPPNPYAASSAPPTPYATPYAPPATATSSPYGSSPPPYGPPPASSAYSTSSYGGYAPPPHHPPPQQQQYGGAFSPFASLTPSAFPPGTDPNVVACFQMADRDGSGFIDDKELQGALSSYNQTFSIRTVHLLMYHFTGSNVRKIGPKEFTSLFYGLQNWRATFERFDRDRSGKIDANELREALLGLGFAVSPPVLDLLISKFDKTGGKVKAVEYDNFIECCLTVKGLTEKFKEKDPSYMGSATFTYDAFMLAVLPFIVA